MDCPASFPGYGTTSRLQVSSVCGHLQEWSFLEPFSDWQTPVAATTYMTLDIEHRVRKV